MFGTAALPAFSFTPEEADMLRRFRANLVYQSDTGNPLLFDIVPPTTLPEGYNFSLDKLDKNIVHWSNMRGENFVLQRTKPSKSGKGGRTPSGEFTDDNGGRGYNFAYRAFTGHYVDGKPSTKVIMYPLFECLDLITSAKGLNKGDPKSKNYATADFRFTCVLESEEEKKFDKKCQEMYLAHLAMLLHLESGGMEANFERFITLGENFKTSSLTFNGKTGEGDNVKTTRLFLLHLNKYREVPDEFIDPMGRVIPYTALNKSFVVYPFMTTNRIYIGTSQKSIQIRLDSAVVKRFASSTKAKGTSTLTFTKEEEREYLDSLGEGGAPEVPPTFLPTSLTQQVVPGSVVIPGSLGSVSTLGSLTIPDLGSSSSSSSAVSPFANPSSSMVPAFSLDDITNTTH